MMQSLNIAVAGLRTSRYSVDNTSNNIANQNTDGFVKRDAETSEIRNHGNIVGDGARLDNISRVFDRGMQSNIISATSKESYFKTQKEIFSQVETITRDIDNKGIYTDLIDFFSSIEDVKSEPSSKVYKNAMKYSVDKLIFNIDNLHNEIEIAEDKLSGDGFVVGEIDKDVAEINRITKEIVELNKKIKEHNKPPLGLFDKRDNLEMELSQYVDIKVVDDKSYVIYMNDDRKQFLAYDMLSVPITYEQGPNDTRKHLKLNGEHLTATSGSLKAKAENDHNGVLKNYKDELENLVRKLTDETNIGYNTMLVKEFEPTFDKDNTVLSGTIDFKLDNDNYDTIDVDGKTLQDAIDDYNADNSKTINLDLAVKTLPNGKKEVHFIRENINDEHSFFIYKDPANGDKFSFTLKLGANDTMLPSAMDELSRLQFKEDIDFGVDKNGNQVNTTLYKYYENITLSMANDVYTADEKEKIQNDIVVATKNIFDDLVKVDLDDEMIDLMKFQASYQANAKMITAVDEMIQTLLGLKR